jgi:4,5-DOPA dioxygenase extradiol
MQRRTFLSQSSRIAGAGACASAAVGVFMTDFANGAALDSLKSLKKSARMPVMFLGHGSPMNAIEDNEYRRSWQFLGDDFGSEKTSKYPKPQLILCISAHWLTQGWHLTGMAHPKTIHDFGGFPQELFAQQYPAPGAPEVTAEISKNLLQPGSVKPVGLDMGEWGLDHGTWSVLKPMFPKADIPVVQLSMDYARPAADHFALGQQLRSLRDHGVLIVGSGNVVHNLRAAKFGVASNQAYDWAIEFDKIVADQIQSGNLKALQDFQKLGQVAQMAHPSYDHYLPVLYAAGAVHAGETVRSFNTNYQAASISMRSVIWG